jgi:hypothetical protein
LEHFCKIYERNKKTEKKREERKKINKRAPGKPFGPTPEASRGPVANPKRYPSVLPLPR